MYPEGMVAPMRQELTAGGIEEARTAADVENAINQKGTLMVVVNSICGCAAGRMRPGVRAAIQSGVRPDRMITVFAGQDREATDAARSHFTGFPPTSPSIALMRDGKLVYMMQRHDIETSDPMTIATRLKQAFEKHCASEQSAISNWPASNWQLAKRNSRRFALSTQIKNLPRINAERHESYFIVFISRALDSLICRVICGNCQFFLSLIASGLSRLLWRRNADIDGRNLAKG